MALGGNLKKKKLIPDPTDGQTKKKASSKKSSVKSDKKVGSSVKPVKDTSKTKKTIEKNKTEKIATKAKKPSQKASKSPKTDNKTKSSEEVQEIKNQRLDDGVATADLIPPTSQEQGQKNTESSHDQIISAYSIYIAQELYERKTALRKQYVQQIANLQGVPVQFILLTIGTERYALDIDCVKEVVPIPTISKTPNTPDHMKGVVNVRGSNYVVFDLARKFQVIAQEVPRYLLVLSNKKLKSSIPLSVLPSTFKTNGSQISYSLQTIENAQLDASYIKGMIQDNEDLIYYLDIVELLKNDKAIVIPEKLVRGSE